jgi:PAS domain-containing protein
MSKAMPADLGVDQLLPSASRLFDHLPEAVYLLDPETSNIVWANRMAWESLGLGPEDVLNHSVLSLQKDVHGLPQWSDIAQAMWR